VQKKMNQNSYQQMLQIAIDEAKESFRDEVT